MKLFKFHGQNIENPNLKPDDLYLVKIYVKTKKKLKIKFFLM